MLTTALSRTAYRAQQASILLQCAAAHRLIQLVERPKERPSPEHLIALRGRYEALLTRDLANVEAGLYPRALLFQLPIRDYVRKTPKLLADMPRAYFRKRRNDWRDIPDDTARDRYPAYFRRTFHWQTDGYLSEHSAELYDLGVEFLFMGTADVMRRQIIPPVTRFLREEGTPAARLLDVACGTGRTLQQLAVAHPGLRLSGLDLSPHYAAAARALVRNVPDASIVAENAESMPYRDGWFDVVTSVYLFHELPHRARRNVVREMMRVLRPGGLLVIEDSAQPSESPDVAFFLGRFSAEFHEPFYAEYLRDDLGALLAEEGFVVHSTEPAFLSKVVVARKP